MTKYRKLKWLSLFAAAFFVAAFFVSNTFDFGLMCKSGTVGFSSGQFQVMIVKPHPSFGPRSPWFWRRTTNIVLWTPTILQDMGLTIVRIPLWILSVLALAAAWWFDRKPRARGTGHCLKCGYNLYGNLSGVCPECETPVPCVKCGYNLSGNESGVCPECGTSAESRCMHPNPEREYKL